MFHGIGPTLFAKSLISSNPTIMIEYIPYIMHGIMLMLFFDRALMFFLEKSNSYASIRVKRVSGIMYAGLGIQSLLWLLRIGVGQPELSTMINLLIVPPVIFVLMELSYYKKVTLTYAARHVSAFIIPFILYILFSNWGYQPVAKAFYYIFMVIVGVYSIYYIVSLVAQIEKYNRNVVDFYSASENYSIDWLYRLMGLVLLIYVLFIVFRLIWNNYWTQNLYYLLEMGFWAIFAHKILYMKNAQKMQDSNQDPDEPLPSGKQPGKDEFLKQLDEICRGKQLYLKEDLNRDDVVREMGTNRTYFSRKLKEFTGQNFNTYINDLRLQEAARLLKESDAKIDSIFAQCGFSNKSTFYRTFQEKYNCTPTKFRQQ